MFAMALENVHSGETLYVSTAKKRLGEAHERPKIGDTLFVDDIRIAFVPASGSIKHNGNMHHICHRIHGDIVQLNKDIPPKNNEDREAFSADF